MNATPNSLSFYDEIVAVASPESLSHVSDILLIRQPEDNSTIRIGTLYSMTLRQTLEFGVSLAAVQAVRDFNQRTSPYSKDLAKQLDSCNFYLTIDSAAPTRSLIDTARMWQDRILFPNAGKLRPMTMIGPITSDEASMCAELGGTASRFVNDTTHWNTTHVIERNGRLYNLEAVPNISPAATSPALDSPYVYPYFGRTIASNVGDVQALLLYLNSIQVDFLSVIYVNTVYGRDFFLELATQAPLYGVQIRAYSYMPGEPLQSSSTIIQQLRMSPFKYVFCIWEQTTWESIAVELHQASLLGDPSYAWFFSDAMSFLTRSPTQLSPSLAAAMNRTAIISIKANEQNFEIHQRQMAIDTKDATFLAYWRSRFPESFQQTYLADPNNNISFVPTVTSMLTYDAITAVGLAACQFGSDQQFTSPELFDALVQLDFAGASGRVAFNTTTGSRDPDTLVYQLTNIFVTEQNGTFLTSGVSSVKVVEGKVRVLQSLVFPSGSIEPPPALLHVNVTNYHTAISVRILNFSWAGIVIVLSIFCMVWSIVNRAKPAVKAAQPEFLVTLSLGPIMVAVAVVLANLSPDRVPLSVLNRCCTASAWLFFIGYVITFSAIFAKTWRIYRVHRSAMHFRRITVLPKDVLWPLFLMLAIMIGIMTAFTVVAPLEYHTIVVAEDPFNRTLATVSGCAQFDSAESSEWIFLGLASAVVLVALILSQIQSYRARNLPSDYNETFYLAITNAIILENLLIGLPLVFMAGSDPTLFSLLYGLIGAVFSFGVLLPMFVPKFTRASDIREKRSVKQLSRSALSSIDEKHTLKTVTGISSAEDVFGFGLSLVSRRRESAESVFDSSPLDSQTTDPLAVGSSRQHDMHVSGSSSDSTPSRVSFDWSQALASRTRHGSTMKVSDTSRSEERGSTSTMQS